MPSRPLKGNGYLLLATLAWGTTFVVQRTAMDHVGPFTYSGLRFLLGALFLLPFVVHRIRARKIRPLVRLAGNRWLPFNGALLTGSIVFVAINLQQIGLQFSTAGKGGFITGLYVIIVPILGIFFGQRIVPAVWFGALLAATGLFLLSITSDFSLAPGDGWILACAFVWALQVHSLSWLSPKIDSFILALGQSLVCSLLSLAVAFAVEPLTIAGITSAAFDIAYGGIVSVGLGYTLQVAGQKYAKAPHAAIIMQFEAVFAALAGWIFLGEGMTLRALSGCGLMLAGMLIAAFLSNE